MRWMVLFFLCICAPAFSADFLSVPVGNFGGFRLRMDCELDENPQLCLLDTAASESILAISPFTEPYPKGKKEFLGGVGGIGFECETIEIRKFVMADSEALAQKFLVCPGFSEANSPLIGVSFFQNPFTLLAEGKFFWESRTALEKFTFGGPDGNLFILPGTIEGVTANFMFDTGNPVTLVDVNFIRKYPKAFKLSNKPPSEMMIRRGFRAYDLKQPIKIGGVSLNAAYAYGGELDQFSQKNDIDVILGANHILRANWHFDPKAQSFSIWQ